jgi:succinyl-diaminopimelate desuccinylase
MKSGVACFVAAAARHLERHGPPAGSVSLLITGDEEADAVNGTAKLLEWCARNGEAFDACVVGEPTCPQVLGDVAKTGRRGSLDARLTVRGRQGHTAYPGRADNAAHRLLAVLADLARDAAGRRHRVLPALEPGGHLGRRRQPRRQRDPGRGAGALNIRFNDRHTRAA